MKLYDDIIQVYEPKLFSFKSSGGKFIIEEPGKEASVRKLCLDYHGQLMIINNIIFQKTDFLYKRDEETPKGLPEMQHGCDGVAIIEKKNKKFIIFIELKSEFSRGNIKKAERQLYTSYFRIMELLYSIEDFNPDEYKKCGIIVSHPLSSNELVKISKKKEIKIDLDRYEKQCLSWSNTKLKSYNLDKRYSGLGKLPVKEFLYFENLPVFHLTVNEKSKEGQFDLDELLNKL